MANTVSKVIKIANGEVGYLEKESAANLNSKTKNAGDKNYTKYGKWFGMNGVYWCAIFLSWIFNKAYGTTEAKKLLCGEFSAACETIRQQFIKSGKYHTTAPKKGDVIFFTGSRHSGANHIGLVYKVNTTNVYTIEGNTSGGSTVIDNGGSVAKKTYPIRYKSILGYGSPEYDVKSTKLRAAKPTLKKDACGAEVKVLQKDLNKIMKSDLTIDGCFNSETEKINLKFKKKYNIGKDGAIYGKKAYKQMKKLLK